MRFPKTGESRPWHHGTITRQLVDAGRLLDIPVYDHLVLGAAHYLSFAEAGLL